MIESLTKEQEEKIKEYEERFRKAGTNTTPTNREKAEAAIIAYYAYNKMKKPEIMWVEDPLQGCILAAKLLKGSDKVTKEEVSDQVSAASFGTASNYWLSSYAFVAYELPVKRDNLIDIAVDICAEIGVYWSFEDCVILCPKPTTLVFNKKQELENKDGYAVQFPSGWGFCKVGNQRFKTILEAKIAGALGEKS